VKSTRLETVDAACRRHDAWLIRQLRGGPTVNVETAISKRMRTRERKRRWYWTNKLKVLQKLKLKREAKAKRKQTCR
jgi:hypothetical protein